MRVLLTPAGSRGDFQPLLALAVGLKRAGHRPVLGASACFAGEARAFGIPFVPVGLDIQTWMQSQRETLEMNPLTGAQALMKVGREELPAYVDELLALAGDADRVVGGGAQIAAPTAAEAAGVPYRFVAYTPQLLRSDHHAPGFLPFAGAPPFVNRICWTIFLRLAEAALGPPLRAKRRELGLGEVENLQEHFVPTDRTLVAADPEVAPPPADVPLRLPAVGSLHLEDDRPLPREVRTFLDAGDPPVYVGFGSMPDPDPARTTRAVIDAARAVGRRVVISAGWAGLGGPDGHSAPRRPDGAEDDVLSVGPISHRALFPHLAAAAHHGGAGTTASVARAGIPQVVVPHAFDQFQWAHLADRAGIAARPLPRTSLTWERLAAAFEEALSPGRVAAARALGEKLRRRDAVGDAVRILTAKN